MLLREGDEILVEIQARHAGRRIGGVAGHDGDGLGNRMDDRPLKLMEEIRRRVRVDRTDHAARHEEAEGVDGIGGVGHHHHIARGGDGLGHIGEALLGAEGRDHLGVRIELHAEAALVIGGLGAAQARNALGGGIAVGARLASGLDQFLDHMAGSRQIGVAHAEVDDVGPIGPRKSLQAIHLFEHIGWQALDAMEVAHRFILENCAGVPDPGRGANPAQRAFLRPIC